MRKLLLFIVLILQAYSSFGQFDRFYFGNGEGFFDGRAGITVGTTNYVTDTNLLFSKSGTGYTIGLLSTIDFSERLEIFLSIDFNSHRMKFVGKETEISEQEDIKFKLDEVAIPILLNYNVAIIDEDIKIGVFAGPAFHFIHNYKVIDDAKATYLLEPLLASPSNLRFDESNGKPSFNVFGSVGLSAQYNNRIVAQLKYSQSITDPYRQAPIFSNFVDISGQDSIITFSLTYLFSQI